MFSARDKSLSTGKSKKIVLTMNVDDKCHKFSENVQHLVSGRPALAQTALKRHGRLITVFAMPVVLTTANTAYSF